ncbi:MAG TPA: ornithine cyclodeaminase family protein [Acidimicrobiia bacterium]|jgi:ornithine cyclodeaminase/alanine dehydrogenase-like protein (mu-crystallin family)|nr:ornithine cyclodeaminase family protein [Acidimicrobiia bacterium]
MRILDAAAVDELIEYPMVLDAVRDLFSITAGPEHIGYGRIDLAHPKGWLRSLPAYVISQDLLGFKVLHRTEGVGMRYTVYVHGLTTGEPRGIVDALEVTNARTGAVTAVATEHLAPEVEVAALIGTGPVARGQLRALELVRPAREVRVFARTPARREGFVEEMADHVSGRLVAVDSLDEALEGASMVTLATKAAEPVLRRHHLRPGLHVNSVGPASRDRVEVDPAVFKEFDRVVCDSIDLVLDEAGDAYQAVSFHGFDRERASDLADVVSGSVRGRVSDDEITLFKSVGTGAQDLVVAARLLDLAEQRGVGTVVGALNSVKPG